MSLCYLNLCPRGFPHSTAKLGYCVIKEHVQQLGLLYHTTGVQALNKTQEIILFYAYSLHKRSHLKALLRVFLLLCRSLHCLPL